MACKTLVVILVVITIVLLVEYTWKLQTGSILPIRNPVTQRTVLKGLRQNIFESNWIQTFPDLKSMVKVVNDEDPMAITNTKHTSIKLLNSNDLEVGGSLKAIITSRSETGENKVHGGDFFAVILRPPGSRTDGVACDVKDLMNGKYSVSCILPWDGAAVVEATLIHPSEAIYELMKRYSSEREYEMYQNTTMLNSKNKTEFTACSIGFPDKRPDEICDYSNPSHGEKRTCLRTPSGECPKVILYHETIRQRSAHAAARNLLYCNNRNYLVPITGSGGKINIRKSKMKTWQDYFTGNLSKFEPDPRTPSGWLLDGKWVSIKTRRSYELDSRSIEKCFANKRLHFFGDSTSRGIYKYFIRKLNIKDFGLDNRVVRPRGRDAFDDRLNMTIQYRSHGYPLHNPGPEDSRPYMSDSLDAMREGGKGTIVIFTIGYHFHYYTPDAFVRRLKIIKNAVISLLRRLPGAKVIIKGLYYHRREGYSRSPWLTYKCDVILRHMFNDVVGLSYAEHWDYTLLVNNGNFHPEPETFQGAVKLLMPYIC